MVKSILITGFLSLTFAFNSHAHDSGRIEQQENESQELKLRLSELESVLGTTQPKCTSHNN